MMGRSSGTQAGGWDHRGCPMDGGVVQIKLFPTQYGSGYFLGQEMEDRVKCQMDGGPTASVRRLWPHCNSMVAPAC